MNLLLSYPRSANTWLRCCLEVLTRQKTHPHTVNFNMLRDIVKYNSEEILLYKRHELKPKDYTNGKKLIFLLRNYKEVIIRHCKCKKIDQCIDYTFNTKEIVFNYIRNLEDFYKWKKDKLLIYYEDLLTQPEIELKKCLDFLNFDYKYLKEFMDNYDKYKKISINVYNQNNKSVTKGNDLLFHSNILSKEEKIKWDNIIKEKVPNIYNKYLKRYEEI